MLNAHMTNETLYGTMLCFNGELYLKTGRSHGLARVSGTDVFVGTDFYVRPDITHDGVEMGRWPNRTKLTPETIGAGCEIVIRVFRNQMGWAGHWCTKAEWEAAQTQSLQQRITNPRTVEEAQMYGWEIKTQNGRQIVLTRQMPGDKTATKTFHVKKDGFRTKLRTLETVAA